ncbi:HugZ family protein [Pseudoalteromonas fenneropenaei]|uniref:HugZ family protein n=1 Tax=Pseudoalteromonas fenneropenaei TaxID=1737459 RepID=A0ABV7CII9_9GAMM
MRKQAVNDAKALLTDADIAVLSTNSNTMPGFPFGSMVQFLLLESGDLCLFISDLAQHTKNLAADGKLSLTVIEREQLGSANAARLTVMGRATQLARSESLVEIASFCEKYRDAEQYAMMGDFNIWLINIERLRFIGGFGQIFWLERDEWYAAN